MKALKLLLIFRDFVPEYHNAKSGGNWTTNKGKTEKKISLNRVNFLAVSQKVIESYDSTIALRFNRNQV